MCSVIEVVWLAGYVVMLARSLRDHMYLATFKISLSRGTLICHRFDVYFLVPAQAKSAHNNWKLSSSGNENAKPSLVVFSVSADNAISNKWYVWHIASMITGYSYQVSQTADNMSLHAAPQFTKEFAKRRDHHCVVVNGYLSIPFLTLITFLNSCNKKINQWLLEYYVSLIYMPIVQLLINSVVTREPYDFPSLFTNFFGFWTISLLLQR